MTQIKQLALSVQLPDDETFESFYDESNLRVVTQLRQRIENIAENVQQPNGFYLFGVSGVGKSHLLHACCTYASSLGLSTLCLPFSELTQLTVEVIEGLEHIDVICLDDVELIAGNEEWQQAVFDLFNRVTEQNKLLVISGNQSVNLLGITLPDLVSRISWGLVEQVKEISDQEKLVALQQRALQRGLMLNDDAAKYLLSRLSRKMGDLLKALDELDRASIEEKRKITIPFIKTVLSINA